MKERKDEKKDGAEIAVSQSRFLSWLDNFWYHYSLYVLIIAFFLFVAIFGFVQCSTKENGDITVTFSGGYSMNASQKSMLINALSGLVPKEGKEGETVTVLIPEYPVFSDEEIRALFTDEDGNFSAVAYENMRQQCVQNRNDFGDYVMTGDCSLYLVRESVYQEQNLASLAVPLTDYFQTAPTGAFDDYAVRLGDTAFYQYYEALHFLPADTLIVLTKPYIYGSSSQKSYYEQSEALFLAILNFQMPQS